MGEKNVSKELNEKKIGPENIKKIMNFIKLKNIQDAKKHVENENIGKEGITELDSILDFVDTFGFLEYVKFDLSLVRGLEYYTGPVFEISAGLNVSVGGGGRYDNLIEAFGGKPIPATGISFGIDRVMLAMEEKRLIKTEKTKTKIYIAPVVDTVIKDAIILAKKLILLDIPAEFDVMKRSLTKELDYANVKGIPYVIVLGEKEIKSGKAKLRDMKTGQEWEINLHNPEEVRKHME